MVNFTQVAVLVQFGAALQDRLSDPFDFNRHLYSGRWQGGKFGPWANYVVAWYRCIKTAPCVKTPLDWQGQRAAMWWPAQWPILPYKQGKIICSCDTLLRRAPCPCTNHFSAMFCRRASVFAHWFLELQCVVTLSVFPISVGRRCMQLAICGTALTENTCKCASQHIIYHEHDCLPLAVGCYKAMGAVTRVLF